MILLFIFALFLLSCNGQDSRFTKIQNKLEVARNYENSDFTSLLEPLISLKKFEFYEKLSSKLADIPNFNFNVTSECEEDFLIIAVAVIDPNNTAPALKQILSQSL